MKIEVKLLDCDRLRVGKVVVDDGYNLIEYPVAVSLSGVLPIDVTDERMMEFNRRRGVDSRIRYGRLELYLVILDGLSYHGPIRGWIHFD